MRIDLTRKPAFGVRWVAVITFGSGVASLLSIAAPNLPARRAWTEELFPFELIHASRSLALLAGFALILASLNLWKRKRRAWQAAVGLSAASIPSHLLKGHDHAVALVSLLVLLLLIAYRRHFTVRSGTPDFSSAFARIGIALAAAVGYGVGGFWFLDPRAFGVNFRLADALRETLVTLSLGGLSDLQPHTHHAIWFLDSLRLVTLALGGYILVALFRPVVYVYRTAPRERVRAAGLLAQFGRSSLDYFKVWPDKSFFFNAEGDAFIAYRVGAGYAVALGDPVGPDRAVEPLVREFAAWCAENDWRVAFHQTLPDHVPTYLRLGFRKLKVGDEAIVDLEAFSLAGKASRDFRHTLNQLEKQGLTVQRLEPPQTDATLRALKRVSDDWLAIPGRRERRFTLGYFDPDYLRATPVLVARDASGEIIGFVNIIPSYARGEATIDLMRRTTGAPPGTMDFLILHMILDSKRRGFRSFNLGLAPMSGFQEREDAGPEERAVHYFIQRLIFLFSYRGLKAYKAKFATRWEPRYTIYRGVLELPRIAVALGQVSEMRD